MEAYDTGASGWPRRHCRHRSRDRRSAALRPVVPSALLPVHRGGHMRTIGVLVAALLAALGSAAAAQTARSLSGDDLFALQVASDPRVRPGGGAVAYVRQSGDIMTDRMARSIWTVDIASGAQRPLVSGPGQHYDPRWSPDGSRI